MRKMSVKTSDMYAKINQYPKSHYQCVVEFHTVFEHPMRSVPEPNIFDIDPKLVTSRISFIESEIDEFKDAFRDHDSVEMADALCDILYFSYGTGVCFGVDMSHTNKEYFDLYETTMSPKGIPDFWNMVDARMADINSQLQIFKARCAEKQLEHAMVSLCNMNTMIYALALYMNFDIDLMYHEVHRSNMTKSCETEADAIESVRLYQIENKYKSPCYKCTNSRFIVYNADDKKILKNYKWTKPNLEQFITTSDK
jgi:predicted HAD superfamily Cof-like phosphohydrolase